MKIAWLSNAPWVPTGYGNQTQVFVPRLRKAGHELAVLAFYGLEGGVLNWDGIPVYPKGYDAWGNDVATAHAATFEADILISLMDTWVLRPDALRSARWCPWFPIDMDPLPPPVAVRVAQSYQPIVFSRFGERVCREAGIEPLYVPHGVDTNVLRPGDRATARKILGWPEDAFIVGMVAANKGVPSRKALPEHLEAFAQLRRRHSDAVLYLHTTKGEAGELGGVNLVELCEHLGLRVSTDVLFADQYGLIAGYTPVHMAALYNGMDVLASVSMGEGFGVPIMEAQACGTPVIVGDWTAMSELRFAGWAVPQKDAHRWWTPLASFQWIPKVGASAEMMEAAYRRRGDAKLRERAREGALAYDADRVTADYWQPALETIAQRIADETGAVAEAVAG